MNKRYLPLALFDELKHIEKTSESVINRLTQERKNDYLKSVSFLKSYAGSIGTFNSYRREVEKLLHWSWDISQKSIKDLRRNDIENFIHFTQKPHKSWIGLKKATRFIEKEDLRISNPEWRPFVATLSKSAHKKGEKLEKNKFAPSQGTTKETFAILSTFYNFLLQDEYAYMNPVSLIRQKSKFIRKQQGHSKIRRLSDIQWKYVMNTVIKMAETNPEIHERTLFIMSALYSMYLRISELAQSQRWTPQMNHFQRDGDENWWFTTVGKGNKQRQIAVSNSMLSALKRWRKYLGLSALPSAADQSALLPKTKGRGAIKSTTYIRKIVQNCFDRAVALLNQDNFNEEAESLIEATVHWLRHTGISDDVKHRPREHVRDDAGHSSGATTDKYIDIELHERHRSAKNKRMVAKT